MNNRLFIADRKKRAKVAIPLLTLAWLCQIALAVINNSLVGYLALTPMVLLTVVVIYGLMPSDKDKSS